MTSYNNQNPRSEIDKKLKLMKEERDIYLSNQSRAEAIDLEDSIAGSMWNTNNNPLEILTFAQNEKFKK